MSTSPWSFVVSAYTPASPERVFDLISDHAGYSRWTPLTVAELVAEGSPDRNGTGAIRRLGGPGYSVQEQVIAYDAPRSFSYTIISGLPVRGYRADVTVAPTLNGGTLIRWAGDFESAPRGLGHVLKVGLKAAVADLCRRAARAATA